jgi:hypothetical protein
MTRMPQAVGYPPIARGSQVARSGMAYAAPG